MHFDILRKRIKGRPMGKRPEMAPTIRGDIRIEMVKSSPMGRPSLCAWINNPNPDERALPALYDIQVNTMLTNGMVITGTEIIDGVAYAQSWHCRVV